MTVKELINLNFGISGIIGIKDVDSLADESIEVLKNGVKDKELKKYYDWEVVAQFPLFISLDEGNKLKKALHQFLPHHLQMLVQRQHDYKPLKR